MMFRLYPEATGPGPGPIVTWEQLIRAWAYRNLGATGPGPVFTLT